MKFRLVTLVLGAAIAAAACGDDAAREAAKTDSLLARDLALANAPTAQPTFEDTAVSPAAAAPAPAPKTETPRPQRPRVTPPQQKREPLTRPDPAPQQQAPAPVAPQTVAVTPAPTPAPATSRGQIDNGASAVLTSGSKVCTSSNLAGDKLVATLNAPLVGTNGVELPAGSTVVLEVASVQSGDKAENAKITFRVRSIVVNDKTYSVAADVTPESTLDRTKVQGVDPNADKKKVAAGAIAGAILGQMIGHNTKGTIIGAAAGGAAGAIVAKAGEKWEACLPAGAQLKLRLNEALVIS